MSRFAVKKKNRKWTASVRKGARRSRRLCKSHGSYIVLTLTTLTTEEECILLLILQRRRQRRQRRDRRWYVRPLNTRRDQDGEFVSLVLPMRSLDEERQFQYFPMLFCLSAIATNCHLNADTIVFARIIFPLRLPLYSNLLL